MSERIDHLAKALEFEESASEIIDRNVMPPHMLAVMELDQARLHAQLALVEQQRIANLIAIGQFSHEAEDGARVYIGLIASQDAYVEAAAALGVSR